jgi:hypothetical protein
MNQNFSSRSGDDAVSGTAPYRLLLLVWALLAGSAHAAEVYQSTGEFGEVMFSDVETSDAQPVIVDTPQPASPAGDDWVAQALDVARMLEESRLAREAAADERRDAYLRRQQAQREMAPMTEPEEPATYGFWYPYRGDGWPGYPGYRPPYRPGGPGQRPPYRPGGPGHRPGPPSQLPAGPAENGNWQSPIPGSNAGRGS